ncbi:MAG TPA: S9 family peptidase [Opitutaceae bacterium]|nr:S9 family peptidase [Opitutaceae bacterium]
MNAPPLLAILLMTASVLPASASFNLAGAPAPAPAKKPKDVTVHGDRRVDDYFWLREKENPEVISYLERENGHTDAVLAPAADLRARLFKEMRARIQEDDASAPIPYLGWLYYTRTEKDRQYPLYCRRADRPGSPEEILLDLNRMAEGRDYIAVGHYRVSDDGRRLAYSIDWTGYRQYEVFVMDLATKEQVPQQVGKVSDLEWGAGHDVLYYVTENEAKRSDKVHRWTLSSARHELLLEEKDELYNVAVSVSNDGRWVFATAESKVTAEVFALRADDHGGRLESLAGRVNDRKYFADHHEGRFYFTTNQDAVNYKVVWADVATPARWTDLIPHNPAVRVEETESFAGHLVVSERENGLPQFRILEFATGTSRRIEFPDDVYEVDQDFNWDYRAKEFRFRYQSLARPMSVFAVDFATAERRLLKETPVLGGFNSADYVATRAWAVARDGVRIPLSIVHRRDLDRSRPQPLWLYGYGSYGISMPITFSSNRVSLLDRGMVYVIAHIRGGGELGEEWRLAGRMEKKMTTFTDFVDCAQWLVDQKWTTPQQMVTSGGSAGGLLMGAVLNLRPDLFAAAKIDVPFVDVLNTMLDASLPLTTEEYVEWGNPNLPEEYRWMRAYSPYDNLAPAAYPHVLVNVSYHDSQVPYWEGAKYLAKLRELHRGPPRAQLLRTTMGAGHSGASGRFDALKDVARDYAFFLSALGLAKPL